MTGNAIKAKSEALELHELSSEELGAVSGGARREDLENKKIAEAMKTFAEALRSL